MKTRKTQLILLALFVTATLVTVGILLQNGTRRITRQVDYALKEAILKDYQERLSYVSYYHRDPINWALRKYMFAPTLGGKVKEYTLRTRQGETIYIFKDSIDEGAAKRFLNQYFLSQMKPVHPDELNRTFRQVLVKYGITGATGITCYLNSECRNSSNQPAAIPASAYVTPRYTLDFTGAVKVQAWIDYDFFTLWRSIDSVVFWLAAELFIIVVLFLAYRRKKRKVANTSSLKSLEIDMEKLELHIGGRECSIQKLDLQLLNLFWERKGVCVDREEIKQYFWPTDDNANEKIDAHIKAIRKILRDFPEYQLVTVRGKGYYLLHK